MNMTNEPKPTSQDSDRKHQKDHILENPSVAKDISNKSDSKVNDMRDIARQQHTNHFTNRAPADKK